MKGKAKGKWRVLGKGLKNVFARCFPLSSVTQNWPCICVCIAQGIKKLLIRVSSHILICFQTTKCQSMSRKVSLIWTVYQRAVYLHPSITKCLVSIRHQVLKVPVHTLSPLSPALLSSFLKLHLSERCPSALCIALTSNASTPCTMFSELAISSTFYSSLYSIVYRIT